MYFAYVLIFFVTHEHIANYCFYANNKVAFLYAQNSDTAAFPLHYLYT